MDILEFINRALENFYDRINPVTAMFTVRLALMGLIYMTLSYNFIYRRPGGGMREALGLLFFLISSFVAFSVPLEFIKGAEHPGGYFVFGVVGVLATIRVIPFMVTGIPYEQNRISMWLFLAAVILIAGQFVFGLGG